MVSDLYRKYYRLLTRPSPTVARPCNEQNPSNRTVGLSVTVGSRPNHLPRALRPYSSTLPMALLDPAGPNVESEITTPFPPSPPVRKHPPTADQRGPGHACAPIPERRRKPLQPSTTRTPSERGRPNDSVHRTMDNNPFRSPTFSAPYRFPASCSSTLHKKQPLPDSPSTQRDASPYKGSHRFARRCIFLCPTHCSKRRDQNSTQIPLPLSEMTTIQGSDLRRYTTPAPVSGSRSWYSTNPIPRYVLCAAGIVRGSVSRNASR